MASATPLQAVADVLAMAERGTNAPTSTAGLAMQVQPQAAVAAAIGEGGVLLSTPLRPPPTTLPPTRHASRGDILSVAPMMEWTDRHYRYLARLLSKHTLLYTEMIVENTLRYSPLKDGFLRFSPEEHPVACQIGGSDPEYLAMAARMVQDAGYDEVNLNCGCPSPRVAGKGCFGAALMREPELVRDCVAAMRRAVTIPVTVKCRLGVDALDSYEAFTHFVRTVAESGCTHFIVHARKAFLKGLDPKANRTVPPLRYNWVQRAALEFPHLRISINGGIVTMEQTEQLLSLRRTGPALVFEELPPSADATAAAGGSEGRKGKGRSRSSSPAARPPPAIAASPAVASESASTPATAASAACVSPPSSCASTPDGPAPTTASATAVSTAATDTAAEGRGGDADGEDDCPGCGGSSAAAAAQPQPAAGQAPPAPTLYPSQQQPQESPDDFKARLYNHWKAEKVKKAAHDAIVGRVPPAQFDEGVRQGPVAGGSYGSDAAVLDSVMIGRAAYNNTWVTLSDADRRLFGVPNPGRSRREVLDAYITYTEAVVHTIPPAEAGMTLYKPFEMAKPLFGLFTGEYGCAKFRLAICKGIQEDRLSLREAVAAALQHIPDDVLDERPPAGP